MTELPILSAPWLTEVAGVRHAFFTRRGGVSKGLYASLNAGQGSRDDSMAVVENRRRVAAHFDAEPDHLLTPYQVHSARAVRTATPWAGERPEADAVVTAQLGLVCSALSADCAPVLLADGEARLVAAVHAGWRGALGGVVEAAVAEMTAMGADPARIVAAIGPCIGPETYEVGLDFLDTVLGRSPEAESFFRPGPAPHKRLFDLPGFVLHRLARVGVRRAGWIGCDTLSDETTCFSNRRAVHRSEGDYGRLISAIALI